jgi:hypothetical protein
MIVRRWTAGLALVGAVGLSVVVPAAPAAAGGGVEVSLSAGQIRIIGTASNDFILVDRVLAGAT